MVSSVRFKWHVNNALKVAEQLTGTILPLSMVLLPSWTMGELTHDGNHRGGNGIDVDDDLGGDDEAGLPAASILLANVIQQTPLKEEEDHEALEELLLELDKEWFSSPLLGMVNHTMTGCDEDVNVVATSTSSPYSTLVTESFIALRWERPVSPQTHGSSAV